MQARQISWMAVGVLAWGTAAIASGVPETVPAAQEAPATVQRPSGQGAGPGGQVRSRKWWIDANDRAELGITDQQSAKLEAIFQSVAPAQRERYLEQQKLEPAVEQLIKSGSADPVHVTQQVERLETLKAQMNATRIMMLYHMQQELSPAQREKLSRLLDRREAERRKSPDSHRRKPAAD